MAREYEQLKENPDFQEWEEWAEAWLKRNNLSARTISNEKGTIKVEVFHANYPETPVIYTKFNPFQIDEVDEAPDFALASGSEKVKIQSVFGKVKKIRIQEASLAIGFNLNRWPEISDKEQASAISYAHTQIMAIISETKARFAKSEFLDGYYRWMLDSQSNE